MPRQMALVGKSGYGRYFREREPGFMQHSLGTFQTPAQQVAVGRHSYRLVEGAREMMRGEACHGSQGLQAYFLVQMRFHILADALRNGNGSESAGYKQPAKVIDQIAYLRHIIASANDGPTQVQQALMRQYHDELDALGQRFNALPSPTPSPKPSPHSAKASPHP